MPDENKIEALIKECNQLTLEDFFIVVTASIPKELGNLPLGLQAKYGRDKLTFLSNAWDLVDAIAAHRANPPSLEPTEEEKELSAGDTKNYIQALKQYRTRTWSGLKEAVDVLRPYHKPEEYK